MPKVDVKRDLLFERLGWKYSAADLEKKAQDDFQTVCFEFGLELDDVTSEKMMVEKEQRDSAKVEGLSDEVIYKVEIPANRYDLLCLEGLTRGLNIFREKTTLPRFETLPPQLTLTVTENTASVRPYAVAAVLRNVTFTETSYNSFIDLQEKLHQNIARKRTLVAIGTHDLDTLAPPFVYDAQTPSDIKFKPLRAPDMTKEYAADELMTAYESDQQLKHYLHILHGKEKYPVIRDSKGTVLSMPPIINGFHSRITLETKNVFIECTATDLTKAETVLNMIVCAFSEYCAKPFTIESVNIKSPRGDLVTPNLSSRIERVEVEEIYKRMGIPRTVVPAELARLLTRMQLSATLEGDKTLVVEIPPTRPDVLHAADIWEDAAISYGFNNIKWTIPKVATVGKQLPVNKLTDQLRNIVALAGFHEALTFALCRHDDNYRFLRRPDDNCSITIANPQTAEFQVARTNLLSGLLKTVSANNKMPLPMRVFEISDVVLKDASTDTGARNIRRLGALICANSPSFQDVQGLLDRVMLMLGVPWNPTRNPDAKGYYLVQSADPAFFGELGAADIIVDGKRVGVIGVVHPEVLTHYALRHPCGALELELECFV